MGNTSWLESIGEKVDDQKAEELSENVVIKAKRRKRRRPRMLLCPLLPLFDVSV